MPNFSGETIKNKAETKFESFDNFESGYLELLEFLDPSNANGAWSELINYVEDTRDNPKFNKLSYSQQEKFADLIRTISEKNDTIIGNFYRTLGVNPDTVKSHRALMHKGWVPVLDLSSGELPSWTVMPPSRFEDKNKEKYGLAEMTITGVNNGSPRNLFVKGFQPDKDYNSWLFQFPMGDFGFFEYDNGKLTENRSGNFSSDQGGLKLVTDPQSHNTFNDRVSYITNLYREQSGVTEDKFTDDDWQKILEISESDAVLASSLTKEQLKSGVDLPTADDLVKLHTQKTPSVQKRKNVYNISRSVPYYDGLTPSDELPDEDPAFLAGQSLRRGAESVGGAVAGAGKTALGSLVGVPQTKAVASKVAPYARGAIDVLTDRDKFSELRSKAVESAGKGIQAFRQFFRGVGQG